jgi:CubicO group peptidase (beta-lactamase class C family)
LLLCACGSGEAPFVEPEPAAPPRFTFEDVEFPGEEWPLADARGAGWDPADLEAIAALAEASLSTGLCVVYQGRLLLARQWKPDDSGLATADREAFRWTFQGQDAAGRFVQDVTSIQKSVVALLTVQAKERGDLTYADALLTDLDPATLGVLPELAEGVTLRQLLTMTANVTSEVHGPGTRWAYDPLAPQLLLDVLKARSDRDLDELLLELFGPLQTSALGWATYPEYPSLVGLVATDLDLARVGLLVQERGRWGDSQLLPAAAVAELLRPSQPFNPSYGMLWMLNRPGAILPGGDRLERRPLPHAPEDVVIAQGRSDCALMISASEQLVVVRLGARVPGRGGAMGAGMEFWDELWRLLMEARPSE